MAITPRPLILIRGFGGPDVQDEQRDAYQGFNDGTVYPGRRGDNFIYEGFVLRALKSQFYPYRDATNVVSYHHQYVVESREFDERPNGLVVDIPMAKQVIEQGIAGTLWIYRYYDLLPRSVENYGKGLIRLIDIIKNLSEQAEEEFTGVDIVAHSLGGLIARAALEGRSEAENKRLVHRIVTLGTPHRGISFQVLPTWLVRRLPTAMKDELDAFGSRRSDVQSIPFPSRDILTVVGTDYRTYGNKFASAGNRLTNLLDEGTLAYNRSDGLVKQTAAQLPRSPRTFVHKCHGGRDSLITSREAYEIAMRFLHGTHHIELRLNKAEIRRGRDAFGKSEFYFGVSIKPRYFDFDLFHQSADAQNCYGPFRELDLMDALPDLEAELEEPLSESDAGSWAGPDRLIWEGWVDAMAKPAEVVDKTLVFRLDVYLGERDSFGVGFSDNVVFRKQYYVQAVPGKKPALYLHTGEKYLAPEVSAKQLREAAEQESTDVQRMQPTGDASLNTWQFEIDDAGFKASLAVSVKSSTAQKSAVRTA
ncbi:esterase/lipase family protein [Streptomyces goshikiensis]|uniref:esterase/lipase family protein n=1 Tax=Streptomyces goshikiensis TaxID=1942 RepID=UPI003721DFBE